LNNEVVSTLGIRALAEPAAVAAVARIGEPLLEIEDLNVQFETSHGIVRAVEALSYSVHPGEMVAIVGESGSGKSVSALAVMQLLPAGTARTRGSVRFGGRELLGLTDEQMRRIRGREIAMIFQEPMTSLNPVLRIGLQITEPLTIHLNMDETASRARAIELLTLVGITDPESRLNQYPHQLSGGMRQRVMIAIGLACNPKLLIADEPTTALDVTIQAQILELMKELSHRLGIAVVIITHNLGIVARYADRVNVMYAARLVESGTAERVFGRPMHPYARGLLTAVPRLDRGRSAKLATIDGAPPNLLNPPSGCRFRPRCRFAIDKCLQDPPFITVEPGHVAACHRVAEIETLDPPMGRGATASKAAALDGDSAESILAIKGAKKYFPIRAGFLRRSRMVRAVDDVTIDIKRGETLGLVGESGCGKSTLGRLVLRLDDPTAGEIRFEGVDLAPLDRSQMVAVRKKMQVIFQDPYSSLNPRMTVGQIIAEPIRVHGILPKPQVHDRVAELLQVVGLFPYMALRYPHELSGGQRQRVGIARALAVDPRVIVCDEAVSALDVSIQGQVINLLEELQQRLGLTYLFIAHDLAVVRHISSKVAVMYLGRIVEYAPADELFANPKHPYTRALLAAAPVPDPVIERTRPRTIIKGELPSPLNPPKGCVFHPRCPLATEDCKKAVPAVRELGPGHSVACIHA
jgi:peptide/nickel transport system ATP-binding protein